MHTASPGLRPSHLGRGRDRTPPHRRARIQSGRHALHIGAKPLLVSASVHRLRDGTEVVMVALPSRNRPSMRTKYISVRVPDRGVNLPAVSPISWPAASMRDREDVNDLFAFGVDDGIREPSQWEVPGARRSNWPTLRSIADLPDGVLNFMQKGAGGRAAAFRIPIECRDGLFHRVWVEGCGLCRHESACQKPAPNFVPSHAIHMARGDVGRAAREFSGPCLLVVFIHRLVKTLQ